MKIIIIGAGEVGFNIAQRLSEENHDAVVIEKAPSKIRHIQNVIDVQAILGSGTKPFHIARDRHEAITFLFQRIDHAYCKDVCPYSLFPECPTVK